MSIGLKRGAVQLLPYNPNWPLEFELEANKLRAIFGETLLDIQHVGSTAIPGAYAKPLIDIAVAFKSLAEVNKFIPKLVEVGYEHMPERITPERAFFPKGPRDKRTHHLSIVEFESEKWVEYIGFRDYLRAHPDAVNEYNKLKKELAKRYSNDRYAYTAAKENFIKSLLNQT